MGQQLEHERLGALPPGREHVLVDVDLLAILERAGDVEIPVVLNADLTGVRPVEHAPASRRSASKSRPKAEAIAPELLELVLNRGAGESEAELGRKEVQRLRCDLRAARSVSPSGKRATGGWRTELGFLIRCASSTITILKPAPASSPMLDLVASMPAMTTSTE